MNTKLLEGLNVEQHRAVTWPARSALILAGAGSGKTRVLTTRIAWLIETGQASPAAILAVTFTNKAAREMQERVSALVPVSLHALWMGTFHGLCHRFLRMHYRDAGLPATFVILDVQDQLAAIKRLLKSLALSDEVFPPKTVQNFINHHKEAGKRAEAVPIYDTYTGKLVELYAHYDAQCRREGVVDFAELLLRSYELLLTNSALCEHYRGRFRFILVDEFQDTNPLQYAWLKLLIGEDSSLFAVGDDDQSIYGFRGAEVGNMQALLSDFDVSAPVRLEQNYRSMGNILKAANALIECNKARLGKNLWTQAGEGEQIRLYEALTDREEANYIAEEVIAQKGEGVKLNSIAILYRANAQSRVLEQTLANYAIPYRVFGGIRFFERQEIKHALAYLRLIINSEDDNAFLRIVNTPLRGIGGRTIETLQAVAREHGVSLWEAVRFMEGQRSLAHLMKFIMLINALREQCVELSLANAVEHVINASGLRAMYQEDAKEGEERIANLDELVSAAVCFRPDMTGNAMIDFLAAASLEAREHQASADEDAVTLMTVHAAKGLEFETVFISGLEEGIFPHENCFNERNGLEEERRLMYVAMTRARKQLHLTRAQARTLHGQSRYFIHSRFIDEIPDTLRQRVGLAISPHVYQDESVIEPLPRGAYVQKPRSLPCGFAIGQAVMHPTFGTGIVLASEGQGNDARLQINFSGQGIKWLDLRFAKLLAL